MGNASHIKKIHTLKSRLHIDDEAYRVMLGSYGVESSKDLSFTDGADLVRKLGQQASEKGLWNQRQNYSKKYDDLGDRPGFASPAQLRKISVEWSKVSRAKDKDSALESFVNNRFGFARIEWVPDNTVQKILRAIYAMQGSMGKEYRHAG